MVKMFEKHGKTNWVDSNNVVLGYDTAQSCCEDASYLYYFTQKYNEFVIRDLENGNNDYVFDTDFCVIGEEAFNYIEHDTYTKVSDLDCGEIVSFKLVSPTKGDVYITLYNAHNGYYAHGFSMKLANANKNIHEGYL